MRDINRIDKFCNELAEIWKKEVPDWRFGQLIYNIFCEAKTDPFHWEEDKFMDNLKEYFDKRRRC